MGLIVSNIKFENGIPNFPEIQHKFKEQTGLPLKLVADVNLFSLSNDLNQVTERIIESYKESKTKSINLDLPNPTTDNNNKQENYLDDIRLEVYQFAPIDFFVKENIIRLEYSVLDSYFLASLRKVLFELGGKCCTSEGEIETDWLPPKRWNKLKKWEDYSLFKRPKR